MSLPVYIRRAHRIIASLWLLFLAITLALEAVGGPESLFVTVPLVVLLIALVTTGGYLLARPWVRKLRAR